MPSATRRNVLALLGGGVVIGSAGGAVAYTQPDQTPFVIVNNQLRSAQVVTVQIRTTDTGEILMDDTRTISAGDEQGYTDLVADKPLLVTVRTDNGLEKTYSWSSPAGNNGLGVGITADGIGFEVATPP